MIILLALSFSSFTIVPQVFLEEKLVIIDAGHGGKDSGAVGKVSYEKNIVLDVAKQLKKLINENMPNVTVKMTRDDDTFVELKDRAKTAYKSKADLFISIHANANTSSTAYGTETYALGKNGTNTNFATIKRENSVIFLEDNYKEKYNNFDPNSPNSHIIFSMAQKMYLKQSLKLASKIQGQYENHLKRKNRGVHQANFLVLRESGRPAVLTEIGFVSNPTEEKFINSATGKVYIASAIYRALKEYFLEVS